MMNSAYTQFLEILNTADLQPDDLDILQAATETAPGVACFNKATLGNDPATPNSQPVFSRSGAKIGFVAPVQWLESPFTDTYYLEGVAE